MGNEKDNNDFQHSIGSVPNRSAIIDVSSPTKIVLRSDRRILDFVDFRGDCVYQKIPRILNVGVLDELRLTYR